MSQAGLGVLINALGGDKETAAAIASCGGEIIQSAEITDETLRLRFDGFTLAFRDDGQSCCESRYMETPENLESMAGEVFRGAEIKDGPEEHGEWGECKECQFLEIQTDKDTYSISNYNEHNGYYGGFWVVARVE